MSKKMVKTLCDIARRVDDGTFEGLKLKLKVDTTLGAGNKCCTLRVSSE